MSVIVVVSTERVGVCNERTRKTVVGTGYTVVVALFACLIAHDIGLAVLIDTAKIHRIDRSHHRGEVHDVGRVECGTEVRH